MAQQIHLISIDPQKDFTEASGSLCVPGGDQDMERLASFIGDISHKIHAIHVTLDSHHAIDISHPFWYIDDDGEAAPPFSVMTFDDAQDCFIATSIDPASGSVIGTRKMRTRRRGVHAHTKAYLKALGTGGRYPHVIWPEHCLIGSEGATVYPAVFEAVNHWARTKTLCVNWVAKGSNPKTEHFSAVKAEVPQADDPSTQVNTGFIQALEQAGLIFLTGEALSHCVANTGRDIVANFSDPQTTGKIVLLSDTTSNVPGFDALGDQFIGDMQKLGMRVMTCADAKSLIL